jgi:hypothetical protein
MDNVQRMQNIVGSKRGALDDLKSAYEEASARFNEASKARDLRHKADDLKKELAWSHVAAKEAVRLLTAPLAIASALIHDVCRSCIKRCR